MAEALDLEFIHPPLQFEDGGGECELSRLEVLLAGDLKLRG